jgi:F-type H+-transporting ATPase subunit a
MTEPHDKASPLIWIVHNVTENPVVMTGVVGAILVLLSILSTRNLKERPGALQNIAEFFVESLAKFTEGVMGKEGLRFLPLFGTLTLFILFSNLIGLIPGFCSPTGNWSATIALALCVFFSTHYFGMRKKGISYLSHFLFPLRFWREKPYLLPLNLLADVLFIFIHLIGELARPFSLSIRLFANMFSKHITLVCLSSVVVLFAKNPMLYLLTLFIPILLPPAILGLGIITCLVQTFIFVLLSMVYIAGAIEEEH